MSEGAAYLQTVCAGCGTPIRLGSPSSILRADGVWVCVACGAKAREAERDLLAFLREPETRTAIDRGFSALYATNWIAGEACSRLRTLLSKLDALGDAGTDDGGQP